MWMIVKAKTIYHEGDERSRTHPGHGYPSYTEEVSEVTTFTDYKKFVDTVEELTVARTKVKFSAYSVTPVNVSMKVVVTLSETQNR